MVWLMPTVILFRHKSKINMNWNRPFFSRNSLINSFKSLIFCLFQLLFYSLDFYHKAKYFSEFINAQEIRSTWLSYRDRLPEYDCFTRLNWKWKENVFRFEIRTQTKIYILKKAETQTNKPTTPLTRCMKWREMKRNISMVIRFWHGMEDESRPIDFLYQISLLSSHTP